MWTLATGLSGLNAGGINAILLFVLIFIGIALVGTLFVAGVIWLVIRIAIPKNKPDTSSQPKEHPPVLTLARALMPIASILFIILTPVFYMSSFTHSFWGIKYTNIHCWIAHVLLGITLFSVTLIAHRLPPKPWVWKFDFIFICILFPLSGLLLTPLLIWLLIHWLKPETKRYFGIETLPLDLSHKSKNISL